MDRLVKRGGRQKKMAAKEKEGEWEERREFLCVCLKLCLMPFLIVLCTFT